MHIRNKTQVIGMLENFCIAGAGRDYHESHGDRVLARAIINYLNDPASFSEVMGVEYNHYLPKVLVEAFERLRVGDDKASKNGRDAYRRETGYEVPDPIDPAWPDVNTRHNLVLSMSRLFGHLTLDRRLGDAIEFYFYAQDRVLIQKFQEFVRMIYRHSLLPIIKECGAHGMRGVFGETEMQTVNMAGSVFVTFIRGERSIEFCGLANDATRGLRFGLGAVRCDMMTAFAMIDEVTKTWSDMDARMRTRVFGADESILIPAS